MKKQIIILIIVIAVLAIIFAGFIYYKNYYPYSENAGEITEKDLKCGWYYGDYNQKKIGTPDNWTSSLRGTRSAVWNAPGQGIDFTCLENTDFCGISTNASCTSNNECKTGGCSSQVCEGKNENTITTCEYKDCYDSSSFGVSCKCVSGKCGWN